MRARRLLVAVTGASLLGLPLAATPASSADGFFTAAKPYAVVVTDDYALTPILSVGDQVPEASDATKRYRMVGIPDGMGSRRLADGTTELFVNHELGNAVKSQPNVGGPINIGAFISRYLLSADGSVLAGERAYDRVFNGDTFAGTAAEDGVAGAAPGFGQFCSAYLAGPPHGFDRWIYLTGEESSGAATFDGKGGIATATFDNEIHTLPKMGHFAKENLVVLTGTGSKTVVMALEDGPAGTESQFYMYVGEKDPSSTSVLKKNGLLDGKLYVLKVTGKVSENDFFEGTAAVTWVEVANPETLNDVQLDTASDALGAFGFVRIEDGAQSRANPSQFLFDTTGGSSVNVLGRVYTMDLNLADPLAGATLKVVDNADQIVAAGGDTALSPDNVEATTEYLMVQEDGTEQTRAKMAEKKRDGSIWRYELDDLSKKKRVVQLNPPSADGVAVGPGVWETSGIIDTSRSYGFDSYLFNVQAHPPTTPPGGAAQTVEDGQILLMRPKNSFPLPRPSKGYWATASDGGIFAFGPDAGFFGSTGDIKLNQPIRDMESTLSTKGYWLAASDGGVFAFGDAPFLGSTGDIKLNQPIVDMARTPSGKGYWLVASDGGVFAFGDARFLGSTGDIKLNKPVVAMVPTASGRGYTLIAEDGGVFTFGDAPFLGSLGSLTLNQPILAGDAMESGNGYWLFAADGGVFTFGDAGFFGSAGDLKPNKPIVGGGATGSDRGYYLVGSDGGVFTYGPDAGFFGSTGDIKLNQPIVDLEAVGS